MIFSSRLAGVPLAKSPCRSVIGNNIRVPIQSPQGEAGVGHPQTPIIESAASR
jgi:hypothetical protein